jgi:hypothetical protein
MEAYSVDPGRRGVAAVQGDGPGLGRAAARGYGTHAGYLARGQLA